MNTSEIKAIVESVLFVAGTPVSLRRLAEIIGVAQAEVKPAMGQLMAEYRNPRAWGFSRKSRVDTNSHRRREYANT